MGKGGYFVLTNNTSISWKRDRDTSYTYQMECDFPATVSPYSSTSVYFEFLDGFFKDSEDDSAKIKYQNDNTADSFIIHFFYVNNSFQVQVDISQLHIPDRSTVDLHWWHTTNDQHLFPFTLSYYDGQFYCETSDMSNWMSKHYNLISSKSLSEICIPGSHDSGMSLINGSTAFVTSDNVLTQSKDIYNQLKAGVRYFDIRPGIGNGGQLVCVHYSNVAHTDRYVGANGQDLTSIVNDINRFSAEFPCEVIILNLSHAMQTDKDYRSLNDSEWDKVFNLLRNIKFLCNAEDFAQTNKNFSKIPISNILSKGRVICFLSDTISNPPKFIFPNKVDDKSVIYDSFSDSADFDSVKKDQIQKMKDHSRDSYFILSWTLTQPVKDAILGPIGTSIEQLARHANGGLGPIIFDIAQDSFPHVIYTDYCTEYVSNIALAINFQLEKLNQSKLIQSKIESKLN